MQTSLWRVWLLSIAVAGALYGVLNEPARAQPSGVLNDALRAVQTQQSGQASELQQLRPPVEIYQPVIPEFTPVAPPSRLEALYSARAGRPLTQFGYDILGVPSPSSVVQAGNVQDNYVLGEGDEIVVVLRGQENATYRQRVNRGGQVVFARLNPIPASGRTFGEFREDLESQVSQAYISTNAFVSLGEVRQISVLITGEVRAPGLRVLNALATPLDAILLSGGVSKTGSLRNVALVRANRAIPIDLYAMLTRGASPNLGGLRNGDRIFIPPLQDTVAVSGYVRRPGIYELRNGQTRIDAKELIQLAGGIEIAARYRLSKTSLESSGGTRLVPVPDTGPAPIADGEVLFVDTENDVALERVSLSGATRLTGTRPLQVAASVRNLVHNSNELACDAYTPFSVIVRRDAILNGRTLIPFSLVPILSGASDIPLQNNDLVYIFNRNEIRILGDVATSQQIARLRPGTLSPATTYFGTSAQNPTNVLSPILQPGSVPGQPTDFPVQAGALPGAPMPFGYNGPQFSGPQFSGPQFSGPQFSGPQYSGPQFSGPPYYSPQFGLTPGCIDGSLQSVQQQQIPNTPFSGYPNGAYLGSSQQFTPATQSPGNPQYPGTSQYPAIPQTTNPLYPGVSANPYPSLGPYQYPNAGTYQYQGVPPYQFPSAQPPGTQQTFSVPGGQQNPAYSQGYMRTTESQPLPAEIIAMRLGVPLEALVRVSADHVIWVLDEVRDPGAYVAGDGTTLADMIETAGGLLRTADLSSVEVTSTHIDALSGTSQTLRTSYKGSIQDFRRVSLQPMDVIRLRPVFSDRQDGRVTILGQARYPGTLELTRGERLSSVLERVGGLTEQAYPYGAVFTRTRAAATEREANVRMSRELDAQLATQTTLASSPTAQNPNTIAFLTSLAQRVRDAPTLGRITVTADPVVLRMKPELDIILEPGDTLYIPPRPSTITVSGEVLNAGSFQYRAGLTVRDYVTLAGGAAQSADKGRLFVVFPDGTAQPAKESWLTFGNSNVIPPGSTIVVPRDLRPFDLTQFLRDATQITSQLAITAASLAIIGR